MRWKSPSCHSRNNRRAFEAAFQTAWSSGKETRILRPVRDLTAWIVQNILLSLEAVPFDKDDEQACTGSRELRELPETHRL